MCAAQCCTKTLDCGHLCGGVRGEEKCLPCYQGCDGVAVEKDSYCSVCYTEPLGQAPTVRLQCGHAFHYTCVKHILTNRWNGPRMNFGFMGCPLCKVRGGLCLFVCLCYCFTASRYSDHNAHTDTLFVCLCYCFTASRYSDYNAHTDPLFFVCLFVLLLHSTR